MTDDVARTLSSRGRSNRNKGAQAERDVCRYLWDRGWLDARRMLERVHGKQPGDIWCFDGLSIEVKNVKNSSWPSWRSQARMAADPNDVVMVIRKMAGTTDVGRWTAHVTATDWFRWGGDPKTKTTWCERTAELWAVVPFAHVVDKINELHERHNR